MLFQKKEEQKAKEQMNQPLDFVVNDLDMMMPGSQPMLTGGPGMYSSLGGGFQGAQGPQGGQGSQFGTGYPRQF